NFQKYLVYKREHTELLFHLLKQLSRDYISFYRNRYGCDPRSIEVAESELLLKAKQLNIDDVQDFYHSDVFISHRFQYDSDRKVIRKIEC
ncbi:hypothetical protein GJ496_006021, partial [Pomphorhynchus laevis]